MEEGGHMGELWQVKHKVCCSVLDTLQRFDSGGRESSQEQVAGVEAGDGECDSFTGISHLLAGGMGCLLDSKYTADSVIHLLNVLSGTATM